VSRRADTSGMDERQSVIERRARRTIGVVASLFGLLFLVISFSSRWGVKPNYQDDPTPVCGWLLLGTTLLTGIAVISSFFSRYLISAAIAQSALALTTAVCALLFTFDSNILAIGPASAAAWLGSLLVVFGAFARVNAEVLVPLVEPVSEGRKYVYREDQIVAIEEWADGRLVSKRPATR
jgi:O-antigen/teichoic acid export membrane protein